MAHSVFGIIDSVNFYFVAGFSLKVVFVNLARIKSQTNFRLV
jgi:hypothetical protein